MYPYQAPKIGRNDICPCGSGKKYKKCCIQASSAPPPIMDEAWIKIRHTEAKLIDEYLMPYVRQSCPPGTSAPAAHDFLLGEPFPQEAYERLQATLFTPWLLFDWQPNDQEPIALQYLTNQGHRLSAYQQQFIKRLCSSHYSFYAVLDVIPFQRITLHDILLKEERTIKERSATQFLTRGDIVYARLLSLEGQDICVGMSPYIIKSQYHTQLLDFRAMLEERHQVSHLTPSLLRSDEETLRTLFLNITRAQLEAPLPQLCNTDGDPLEICELSFTLTLEPIDAFNKLLPLTLSKDPSDFLEHATYDDKGHLTAIQFPWLKKGNKKIKSWETTLMGTLILKGSTLTVEVNSKRRAEKIQALLSKSLGGQCIYQGMQTKSAAHLFTSVHAQGREKQPATPSLNH